MQQQNAKIASMARAMGVFKAEIDQIKIYNIYIYIYIYICPKRLRDCWRAIVEILNLRIEFYLIFWRLGF
jgi:hypothetical protein